MFRFALFGCHFFYFIYLFIDKLDWPTDLMTNANANEQLRWGGRHIDDCRITKARVGWRRSVFWWSWPFFWWPVAYITDNHRSRHIGFKWAVAIFLSISYWDAQIYYFSPNRFIFKCAQRLFMARHHRITTFNPTNHEFMTLCQFDKSTQLVNATARTFFSLSRSLPLTVFYVCLLYLTKKVLVINHQIVLLEMGIPLIMSGKRFNPNQRCWSSPIVISFEPVCPNIYCWSSLIITLAYNRQLVINEWFFWSILLFIKF